MPPNKCVLLLVGVQAALLVYVVVLAFATSVRAFEAEGALAILVDRYGHDADGTAVPRTDSELDALANSAARRVGADAVRRVGSVPGAYLLRLPGDDGSEHHVRAVRDLDGVRWAEIQTPLLRTKRDVGARGFATLEAASVGADVGVTDPLFPAQWHLYNSARRDLRVIEPWRLGVFGAGVSVGVVDDGLDFRHPDFGASYAPELSYDFNRRSPHPLPSSWRDSHGTRCAGEIAAGPADGACGVGVAPAARVAGLKILGGTVTDAIEAEALTHALDSISVYSNSWGPADDGATLEAPGPLTALALEHAVTTGRGGLGAAIVFAAGNGGGLDNCVYDGYASSPFTATIGALGADDQVPYYQEPCPAMLAVAYSSNSDKFIATTDVQAGCTTQHSGTSAAAPLAAGIYALALSVNPALTWRDLQHLTVYTSARVSPGMDALTPNAAGLVHSVYHGFGLMDADAFVERARLWAPVPKPVTYTRGTGDNLGAPVLFGLPGTDTSVELPGPEVDPDAALTVEYVAVQVDLPHPRRGALTIALESPSGTTCTLATPRPRDWSDRGFRPWTFVTAGFWGEKAPGTWTLRVTNAYAPSAVGELRSWTLTVHGAPF